MTRTIKLLALLLLLCALPLQAYEEPVHRLMTRTAFERLGIDFRARLGVQPLHNINGRTLSEIMEQAADDEDNLPNPLNHFLDPENDVPLTTRTPFAFFCVSHGMRADDNANDYPFSQNRLVWAPHQYRNALLGPNPGTRDVHLTELFKTFGHVVHLVQDMAQPEHTRNDQHLTHSQLLLGGGTTPSVWETWSAEYLVWKWDGQLQQYVPPVVSYHGYPNVELPDYRSYFQTPQYPTIERKGLANFSNRNFVTQDTNYVDGTPCSDELPRCFQYAWPFIDDPGTTRRLESVDERVIDDGGNHVIKTVDEAIYTSTIYDAYTDSFDTDPFHTFHSLLDMETRRHGCPVYSLGDGSYLSRASMLAPRAVGYSAGLIRHFFRGKFDVTWTRTQNGTYDMKIINTGPEAIGADATVQAVYRTDPSYFGGGSNDTGFIINTAIAGAVPGFNGLAVGESVTIQGVTPTGLQGNDPLTKFERRVVVQGKLGFSANEVIGLVQPPVTTKKLRVEVTWPEANPPRLIWVTDGSGYEAWAPHPNFDLCTGPNWAVPNMCMKSGPAPYNPVTFTVDPMPDQPTTFTFQIAADCCDRSSFTMTTNFYLDDQLVKTQTSHVRYSRFAETTFAQYP